MMRLFIAIKLDDSLRAQAVEIQNALSAQKVGGNYTPRENLHLTLAFLGEYGDPDRVLDVMRSLPFTPFPLTMDRLGTFPEVFWAGFAENPALEAVVRRLRRALAENGIPFDKKKFRAHVTLLRKPVFPQERLLPIPAPRAQMTVSHITLFRSERGKNGMIYTPLGTANAQADAFF